ncbi:MAG TPA: tol-pal system protein YbgF [Thermoanaerobaculia bacterium]|jgi:tol-pal system protein YbgF|nr:tol-pal system protein YbgF [Thermoanaerobaculia bacterium]
MKRVVVTAAVVVLFAGCASRHGDPDLVVPQTVPPADLAQPSNPTTDARLAELQTSMTELLERIDVLNERMNKLEQAPVSVAPAPSPAQAPAAQTRTGEGAGATLKTPASAQPSRALVSAGVADTYRSALMLYGRGKYDDARKTFQQVFDADPTGDLADNALYWIGETYYVAGNYAEAMKFYRRVTAEFSEANKAPDAMFKIALAFEKTSDLGMARNTLDEVIRRYPYSSSAASAKLELKRIKY